VGLFWAGRARVAPGLVDPNGIMNSFASDGDKYQSEAARLAGVPSREGVGAWAAEDEPAHVKLLSIQFALLGPLFGDSTLSAEPLNLFCYLSIVALTLALGREVGGRRAGLIAAAVVALWPTLLLHTTQFLKDPLFIAGALALVLCVTSWLTRDYTRRASVVVAALMAATTILLLLIRSYFVGFIVALLLFGLALLVVRQRRERRPLYWNMACPLLAIVAACAFAPFVMKHGEQHIILAFKHYPSEQAGQPKSASGGGVKLPSVMSDVRLKESGDGSNAGRLYAAADRLALRVGNVRSKFNAVYPGSGSMLDEDVEFTDLKSLMLYLPRASEIGFFAPFPNMWFAEGRSVGRAGRLVSGAETLFIYLLELLTLVAIFRAPRQLAPWLLLSITACGVTVMGLAITNLGTLYRFRYTFWILLIILGAKGFVSIIGSPAEAASLPRGQELGPVNLAGTRA
jgi:4-amino-4-deoxy-L-arabinose transferase-like glycosyltransferase